MCFLTAFRSVLAHGPGLLAEMRRRSAHGGRASGWKRATPCHVYSTSDRTARAEPLLLSESDDRLLRMERFDDRSVELVRLADVPRPDPFSERQLLGLELATELWPIDRGCIPPNLSQWRQQVAATIASPNTFSPSPAHGGRRGRGMRVECLVAASRWHPWHKAQGRPERGTLRRSDLFKAGFAEVRRAKSSNRDATDQNEPEALAEFVRCVKNRLAPQAHGNEKSLLSAVSREKIGKIGNPKNRVQPGSAPHRIASL